VTLAFAGTAVAPGAGAAADAAQAAPAPASAASSAFTHRPLRENQPAPAVPEPTEPEAFAGYATAPPFSVVPRKQHLVLFPCSQCHTAKVLPLNTQVRKLVAAPHNNMLRHGKGRIWCLDCHMGTDRDVLHTVGGTKVDFNESYLVCGQCHSARQRDWYFGGHGKRVAGWSGERQIYACTHCHDPHNPVLQPRAPSKPPPLRAGLSPMQGVRHDSVPPWQRLQESSHAQQEAKP
jgi:hypothetical protein